MKTKSEDLVCSAEQAEKMKHLGVKQCSTFFYDNKRKLQVNTYRSHERFAVYPEATETQLGSMAAFTSTELIPVFAVLTVINATGSKEIQEKYAKIISPLSPAETHIVMASPKFYADAILDAIELKTISVEQVNELL